MRIWIGDNELINKWEAGTFSETATAVFGAEPLELKVEYFQLNFGAHVGLGWVLPGATRPRAIPPSAFYHEPIEFAQMLPRRLAADADGVIHLMPDSADLHGPTISEIARENQIAGTFLGRWDSPGDYPSWKFVASPGDYDVQLGFAAGPESNGSTYDLTVNGAVLAGHIDDVGGWLSWSQQDAGRIHLAGGNEILSIKPTATPHGHIMNLLSVTLTPAKPE